MMTIPENIILLLIRQWKGELLDGADDRTLRHWLSDPAHSDDAETLHQTWLAAAAYPLHYAPDVEAGLTKLQYRIAAETMPAKVVPLRRKWFATAAFAASFLLLLAIGYNWWAAEQSSADIRSITAASGQSLELALPDGSLIVLHNGAEVSYPDPFDKSKARWVSLSGEAYFKIAPDSGKPFTVRTAAASVEVLGTAFNVRAMPDEPVVEVTVEHGKVQLSSPALPDNRLLLQAGERGHCTKTGQLEKTLDPETNALSWLTQSLRFRNTPLPEALEALSRHYGIALRLEKESLAKCTYTGAFEKAPLQDVLQTLELTFGARILLQEESRYLLRGGACGK